ncbi:MAG: GDYXXLXY domain-containing protein [Ignavibacteriaceae bacterium]|nr:GDYXXLXY domain-containing protein [Ignavibacteriaceae bacterium]
MKHKNILFAALLLILFAQVIIPVTQILKWNDVISEGKIYRFLVTPVDPYDPFRGAYIQLNFRDNHWDILTGRKEQRTKRIYVWLATDTAGFASIEKVTYKEPPDTVDCVAALIDQEYTDEDKRKQIRIKYPFDQYFLSADKAEKAEKVYFDALRDSTKQVYAQVRVKSGTGILENVMIGGVPLEGE